MVPLHSCLLQLLLLTTTGSFGFNGAENGILVGFITASKASAQSSTLSQEPGKADI